MMERLGKWGAGLWPLLGLCLANVGCVSMEILSGPTAAPNPYQPVNTGTQQLGPRTVMLWKIESVQGGRKFVTEGKSVIGADGFMKMGPHGTVQVAGLTLDQVRATMQNHA